MLPNTAIHNNSSVFTLLLYLNFHSYMLQHKTSNADVKDINSKFDENKSNSSQVEMTALCTT